MHTWIILVVMLLLNRGSWPQNVPRSLSMCCGCVVSGSPHSRSVWGTHVSHARVICGIDWGSVLHRGGGLSATRCSCTLFSILSRVVCRWLWGGDPWSSEQRIGADSLPPFVQGLEVCVGSLVAERIDSSCDLIAYPCFSAVCSQCGVLQKLSRRGALHHSCKVRGF